MATASLNEPSGRHVRWGLLVLRAGYGLALAAACLAPAMAAGASPAQHSKLRWTPAPVSTLVSMRDPAFRIAHQEQDGTRKTLLAYQLADAAPMPVAILWSTRSAGRQHVAVQRLPSVLAAGGAVLDALTLEHLYALLLRQDAEGRFCLSRGTRRCNAAREGRALSELLGQVAGERARAVARAGTALAAVPWHTVMLKPTAVHKTGGDGDEVSARITLDGRPLAGTRLYFNRAPHSSCVGRSDAEGRATCLLVDQHGDEASHDHDESASVSTTFPGDVRGDRVILPTTVVLDDVP